MWFLQAEASFIILIIVTVGSAYNPPVLIASTSQAVYGSTLGVCQQPIYANRRIFLCERCREAQKQPFLTKEWDEGLSLWPSGAALWRGHPYKNRSQGRMIDDPS